MSSPLLSPCYWQSPELESLREENRRLMVQLDEMMKVFSLCGCVCFFIYLLLCYFALLGDARLCCLCICASFPWKLFRILCDICLSRFLQEEPDNVRLKEEVSELKAACSSSERRIRLLQDELEQARMMTQEFDRAQDHCSELEREMSEARGLLNDKDRVISEQTLVRTNLTVRKVK